MRKVWAALATAFLSPACLAADNPWQIETVDKSGPGRFSSMKADKDGNLHVIYTVDDNNNYPLKYGFRDRALGRWFVMPVASGAAACSLALDSKQRPHISYVDFGTGSGAKLHYARWEGSAWNRQTIPLNSEVIAYYNSIALDAEDRPTISFYEYRGPRESDLKIRLRAVTWNGKYWEVRTVDSQEGSGKFNCAAIGADGRIQIAYANVGAMTAGLRYASWNGSRWVLEAVDGFEQNNGGAVGYSVCMALDPQANPHVVYMNQSTPTLKYATRKDGRWQVEAVERLGGAGYPDRNSIVLDREGQPYLGYYDSGRAELRVAHRNGRQWQIEVVDGNGAGFTSSLAIAGDDLWVSYTDDASRCLKVAHRSLETSKADVMSPPLPPSSAAKAEGQRK